MASVHELVERIRESSDFQERVANLQALAQIVGPEDAEAIAFINKIASYNLYTGLAPYGKKVIAHLKQKYPEIYEEQVPVDTRFEEELRNLHSEDFRERLRVLEYFESEGIDKAVPYLLKLIETEDHPWVISKLTKTTGLLGSAYNNEQILDILLRYLKHEDDRIRANTIEGIGGLRSNRKLTILLDMMIKDSSERVKQMAAIAISFDDTVRALDLLKVMLESDNLVIAENALEALKRLDWIEADKLYREYREILYRRNQDEVFRQMHQSEQFSSVDYDPIEDDPDTFNFDFSHEPEIKDAAQVKLDEFLATSDSETIQTDRVGTDDPRQKESLEPLKISLKPELFEKKDVESDVEFEQVKSSKLEERGKIFSKVKSSSTEPIESISKKEIGNTQVSIQRSDPITSQLLKDILFQIKKVEENAEKRASDVELKLSEVKKSSRSLRRPEKPSAVVPRLLFWSMIAAVMLVYFNFENLIVKNIFEIGEAYKLVNRSQSRTRVVVETRQKVNPPQIDPFFNFDQTHLYQDSESSAKTNSLSTETPEIQLIENQVISSEKQLAQSSAPSQKIVRTTTNTVTLAANMQLESTSSDLTDTKMNASTLEPQVKVEVDKKVSELVASSKYYGKPPENGVHKFMYSNGDRFIGSFYNYMRNGNGTMIFANGEIYNGEWKSDKFHGFGTLTWVNGDKYEGNFNNGLRHGEGQIVWISGERFKGNFEQGKRTGFGVMQYSNGESYSGDWKEDQFEGLGKYTFSNGAIYEGDFKKGIRHGKGVFTYDNGNKYSGTFDNGKRAGDGVYQLQNGESYVGAFENDKYEGDGVYIWANGDRYEGQWLDGQMHGIGRYSWSNGDFYEGQYDMDLISGRGILIEADGRYEGQFLKGLKHGEGVYVNRNGYSYAGDWKEGKKSGYGVSQWSDGEGYSGEWQNDLEHGIGRYIWSSGHKYVGQFYKGLKQGMGAFIWSDGQTQEGLWNEDLFVGKKVQTERLSKLESRITGMVEKETNLISPNQVNQSGSSKQEPQ